jgi:hypothetical protein
VLERIPMDSLITAAARAHAASFQSMTSPPDALIVVRAHRQGFLSLARTGFRGRRPKLDHKTEFLAKRR